MDFYIIATKETKDGFVIYPSFQVKQSQDLMVRGGKFYAVWDEERGFWSKDEYDVARLIDEDLQKNLEPGQKAQFIRDFSNNHWSKFKRFCREIQDLSHQLDAKVLFANDKVRKKDYATFVLDYAYSEGPCPAWEELSKTLYSERELEKIEWAIGSVIAGDSKWIQKFLVFYGPPGSGKSTILNIIERLFSGYCVSFDAQGLGSSNGTFATAAFASNPLVAVQQDGDLSKLTINTKLNSIIAHDSLEINEKYKSQTTLKLHSFLFMGTNQPVRITDAKSGLIRRLIDVNPTGSLIEVGRYFQLLEMIDFELGAIAHKCHQRYLKLGPHYYDGYRPLEMMLQTDVFLNYVEWNYDIFAADDGISLKRAYSLYKEFCEETGIKELVPQYKFREELKNYFSEFHDRIKIDGVDHRSYYQGFHFQPQLMKNRLSAKPGYTIDLIKVEPGVHESVFDKTYFDQPAQYANKDGTPQRRWEEVLSTLDMLDTSKLHYVKVPKQHIVIDFDIKDENGEKSLELNLKEAQNWPPTYTELSKSGKGLHLHYTYAGDVESLALQYDEGIEIKTLLGNSSLRRMLTKCNSHVIAPLTKTLPKKERKMLEARAIQTERSLRDLIERNLRKEIHPGTKPSVEFIKKILDDAYESGLNYDVRDMRARVLTFGARSSNHAGYCIGLVPLMKFIGQGAMPETVPDDDDSTIVFFDVEVYPNLFIVCWKTNQPDSQVVKMINPSPKEIEDLLEKKLVGFNNRRYDNHILYARYLGYDNDALYHLSTRIINNVQDALFGEAYNLSYSDVFDFSSKKQGLKKFQIELGIRHVQLDIPWDKPVEDEKLVFTIADYCANDVISTQAVFEARKQDYIARKILAELSGLSVNHTTQNHTAKIIFGDDKNPQKKFVYTDLSEMFPGYVFDGKESTYRGELVGEGGYVYAEPGQYSDVALLDVASMHPTSIELLDLFGPYTEKFSELKRARIAIKHRDFETASRMLDGKLEPFLNDPEGAEALSYALKIVINIVYGLTSASFDNPFRDRRNKDNIVAKRGALFMIDLKHAVQAMGFTVAHIKTDSIKIPNATPEIIDYVMEFGQSYGYTFEHEVTYDKLCLVNDAVYVARHGDEWTTVGAQFKHPYVYKKMFAKEDIVLEDFFETKSVTSSVIYLDPNDAENVEDMLFMGTIGRFVPVEDGGGNLWRVKDGKKYAVTGTKGYRWIRSDVAEERDKKNELHVDMSYFKHLWCEAMNSINNVGSYDDLIS